MPIKRLLCPQRLRRIPRQFSWIDQRLVREHYIERCERDALALYLLLVTVADVQGLSYYSDRTVCRLLSMSGSGLERARAALVGLGLIAFKAPLYQVLALEIEAAAVRTSAPASRPHSKGPEPIGAPLARLRERIADRRP